MLNFNVARLSVFFRYVPWDLGVNSNVDVFQDQFIFVSSYYRLFGVEDVCLNYVNWDLLTRNHVRDEWVKALVHGFRVVRATPADVGPHRVLWARDRIPVHCRGVSYVRVFPVFGIHVDLEAPDQMVHVAANYPCFLVWDRRERFVVVNVGTVYVGLFAYLVDRAYVFGGPVGYVRNGLVPAKEWVARELIRVRYRIVRFFRSPFQAQYASAPSYGVAVLRDEGVSGLVSYVLLCHHFTDVKRDFYGYDCLDDDYRYYREDVDGKFYVICYFYRDFVALDRFDVDVGRFRRLTNFVEDARAHGVVRIRPYDYMAV